MVGTTYMHLHTSQNTSSTLTGSRVLGGLWDMMQLSKYDHNNLDGCTGAILPTPTLQHALLWR